MDQQLALFLDTTRPALPLDKLDPEELAVARVLRWGRANALQVRDLAAASGISSRRLQEAIERMVRDHGWPIGTSMTPPHGNYLIDSASELQATVDLLRTRGITSLARAAALQRMSLKRMLHDLQTQLEMERR